MVHCAVPLSHAIQFTSHCLMLERSLFISCLCEEQAIVRLMDSYTGTIFGLKSHTACVLMVEYFCSIFFFMSSNQNRMIISRSRCWQCFKEHSVFLLKSKVWKSDLIKGSQSVHAGNKALMTLNQIITFYLCGFFSTGKHVDKSVCDLKPAWNSTASTRRWKMGCFCWCTLTKVHSVLWSARGCGSSLSLVQTCLASPPK